MDNTRSHRSAAIFRNSKKSVHRVRLFSGIVLYVSHVQKKPSPWQTS
jgi:hypothetical protein